MPFPPFYFGGGGRLVALRAEEEAEMKANFRGAGLGIPPFFSCL